MSSDIASRVIQKVNVRNKKKLDGKGQFSLVFRYIALSILFVIAALPIYIMVINSVKGITGVSQSAAFLPPRKLDFSAWGPTWEVLREPMLRTLFFVVQSSVISAIIGSINGFVFAKWRFKGSNFIFVTFLFGMFIPYQAIMMFRSLLASLVVVAMCASPVLAQPGRGGRGGPIDLGSTLSPHEARDAVQQGRHVPLREIIAQIQGR